MSKKQAKLDPPAVPEVPARPPRAPSSEIADITPAADDVGDSDSDEQLSAIHSSTVIKQTQTQTRIESPLPPPDILRGYEEVHPGTMERLLQLTESEAKHRRDLERKGLELEIEALRGNQRQSMTGLWCGAAIALVAIGGGVFLAYAGQSAAGLAAVITPVVGLVGIFIIDRRGERRHSGDSEPGKPDSH